jgi:NADPH:quinone reductase-like Zn-dependent oxidoreductase
MAAPVAAGMGLSVATNGNGASEERMRALGVTTFFDYRRQDYADALRDVDFVLDTLGDRELPKEFGVLKEGGTLVSLRGLPNGEFARRAGLPAWKRLAFSLVGGKYDRMAAKRGQRYRFVFVHEDGEGLARIPELMGGRRLEASVDGVFGLAEVNAAMAKVAAGGSKGKTVLRVS